MKLPCGSPLGGRQDLRDAWDNPGHQRERQLPN